jgi:hypothetical protein
MFRFEGRSIYTTTIPGKPTPTGSKVWALAQMGLNWTWNFHTPGSKNRSIDVRTPIELGGSTKQGKGGNKTQAVAHKLIESLPGSGYHIFMDNLFTPTKFFELLRQRGFGATRTCCTKPGVVEALVEMKKSDKKDVIPWGTKVLFPAHSNQFLQMGWKDNAFCLAMSTAFDRKEDVITNGRRPKETSSKAKTSRVPFGSEALKDLPIPVLFDQYNHQMGAVDRGDQLFTTHSGLRRIKRGGSQALEHWLLITVLVNCYPISLNSGQEATPDIKFRSQKDFRLQIVRSLLELGKAALPSGKKKVAHMSIDAAFIPIKDHELVQMKGRRHCVACKGLRHSDRPQKRRALSEIARNTGRNTELKCTSFGCKQCDVYLCKISGCFDLFHSKE